MMKIIGICGSPRKKSNSIRMVEEVLRGAKEVGAEVEAIKIADLNLVYCDGCLVCDETGRCHIEDGLNEINEKLAKADGLVIGTPDRFDNVSGHLKNFMDRTNPLAANERLKGKRVVLLTVGYWHEDVSREKTIGCLKNFSEAHGMGVVGSVMAYEKSGKPGMIEKKKGVLEKCFRLGQKLVKSLP